jgi:hypothetical protein
MNMYEPLAWTASTIYGTQVSDSGFPVDVNNTNLLPCLDLSISVNIRSALQCPGRGVNCRRLGYQKRSRECGTLGVIVHAELGVDVIVVRSNAGERRKDDTMRKGQSTDFDRGEER